MNRENLNFPCSRSCLRIWSRETGPAIPSRVTSLILYAQAESGANSRAPLFSPAFRHVGDFKAANQQSELIAAPPMLLEKQASSFAEAALLEDAVDKEAYAILSVYRRLTYSLRDEFEIFCDHRNLACIFSLMACATTLSKSTCQRLLNWRNFVGTLSYVICHISGGENH